MANRNFNPPWALEKALTTIVGRVPISSGAAVGTKIGRGFSVAKTATGEYTVTLQDKYSQLLGIAFAQIGSGTIVTVPEMKSEAISTAGTFIIKTVTRSTGATADTAVAFDLCFTLFLRNSSVA
jgi:hypothetical protein